MDIDYERLKLVFASDIDDSLRDNMDIDELVNTAVLNEEKGYITIKNGEFRFTYYTSTYEQVPGMCSGGIKIE